MGRYESIWSDLTIAAHRAYTRGLQAGSGGNLSARLPDGRGMIVKSSGGSFGDCGTCGEGWTAIGFDGRPLSSGAAKPTREWRLHAALLEALPDVGAVVHCHSPWAVAWSAGHAEIPAATWQSGLKLGGAVPVLDCKAAVVPPEELGRVRGLFMDIPGLSAFILRGHGLVAVGKTAVKAEHTAELVEETAKVCVLQALLRAAEQKKEEDYAL
ncbi:class II aldolase/adducin family protein [Agathobaculum sp. NTUH-O15-33]|uniref:class II aldolase/adducin family protein n=1 Tax=Agathobaculum sp. NTUH-O15-33 TaxID=3079302 RepID=UPI00295894DC|nr:class II aldolase/adducin family protein [Agathobaculum sp. NTUH-O15-33]WNX83534.1 class II aldolase/adducin family protein [Agathobaculum sp. NTUH-O15-33]